MSAVAAPYVAKQFRSSDGLSAVSLPEDWENRLLPGSAIREAAAITHWYYRPSVLSGESIADFELYARRIVSEFARWAEEGSLPPVELGVERQIVVRLPPLRVMEVTMDVYFAGPAKPQIFFDAADAQEE